MASLCFLVVAGKWHRAFTGWTWRWLVYTSWILEVAELQAWQSESSAEDRTARVDLACNGLCSCDASNDSKAQ